MSNIELTNQDLKWREKAISEYISDNENHFKSLAEKHSLLDYKVIVQWKNCWHGKNSLQSICEISLVDISTNRTISIPKETYLVGLLD